jgi:hypothetical protein
MAHLQLSRTVTELMVLDVMTVTARPNSRIVDVDVIGGSPRFDMIMTDQTAQRKWKVVGVGMTPPPVGARMVLTLDVVEGDGHLVAGDRLTSSETGNGEGDAARPHRPPPR